MHVNDPSQSAATTAVGVAVENVVMISPGTVARALVSPHLTRFLCIVVQDECHKQHLDMSPHRAHVKLGHECMKQLEDARPGSLHAGEGGSRSILVDKLTAAQADRQVKFPFSHNDIDIYCSQFH